MQSINKLLKKYPRLIALLFGCAVIFFILICGEFACRLQNIGAKHKYMESAFFSLTRHYPAHYYDRDPYGVPHAAPGNHHVQALNPKSSKSTYDIHYSIDPFGRRITPVSQQSQRKKFALFMGCSFTYGEGVNDNETLPYYFGEIAHEFRPYNYGFSGLGPFDFLSMLENYDFSSQIDSRNGVLVYLFIDDHIKRTIGSLTCLSWKENAVYYKEVSRGIFKRQGTFESGRFFTNILYKSLLKSRLFKSSGMDIPPVITNDHIALTTRVIEAMYREFKKKYPKGTFYLVIYPGDQFGQKIVSFLKASGIHIIDFSNFFNVSKPEFHISAGEIHPSPLAYQILAKALAERIAKDSQNIQH